MFNAAQLVCTVTSPFFDAEWTKKLQRSDFVRKQKKLGKSGVISLPLDLRREMHIKVGDPIEIEKNGDEIVIRPRVKRCVICEKISEHVIELVGKPVCESCIDALKLAQEFNTERGE